MVKAVVALMVGVMLMVGSAYGGDLYQEFKERGAERRLQDLEERQQIDELRQRQQDALDSFRHRNSYPETPTVRGLHNLQRSLYEYLLYCRATNSC